MPIYTLKLLNRQDVANQTVVFTFEKPQGFNFIPGQYGGFTLIDPPIKDPTGLTRRFSLLSTPDEDVIQIAVRIQQSVYKQTLNTLPIGASIKFAGPTGNFILHEDKTIPAVMIAGGIGVTPFYSMILNATRHHSTQSIKLFYGNQSPQDTAFLPELETCQIQNPHFKLIAAMDKPNEYWQGEQGYITYTMIKKYVEDLSQPIFYVCGSPAMVTAIQEMLAEAGIDEEKIRVEDFPGY